MAQHPNTAFSPFHLSGLRLRNRIIKSATSEGYCKDGLVTPQLIAWHQRIARGGVGMTTLAYFAVDIDGRTYPEQLYYRDEILPGMEKFTKAIHREGAAASIQLTHCGFFSKTKPTNARLPKGPSFMMNEYGLFSGLPYATALTEADIQFIIGQFGKSAALAKKAGFDAVEIHAGHGYLLSQFLSPKTNRRTDDYGGSLTNRARISLACVKACRKALGNDFPILVKMNLSDGFKGGLELADAVEFAKLLESEGVNALVLSGGFTSKTPFYLLRGDRPLQAMIKAEANKLQKWGLRLFGPSVVKEYPFEEMFFMEQAKAIREVVTMPLALIGGIVSKSNLETAMDNGFELVALGRALIYDPEFVNKLQSGLVERSACTACNLCIPQIDLGGVYCVLKPEQKAELARLIEDH